MRVLGIDPGLGVTGYGIVETCGRSLKLVEGGVIAGGDEHLALEQRLSLLHLGIARIIEAHAPVSVALEEVYSHYRFPRTAILMGHARGVICLAAAEAGLPVFHYGASQVKGGVTGSGGASKDAVKRAVRALLSLEEMPSPADVSDALALAIYHCLRHPASEHEGRHV